MEPHIHTVGARICTAVVPSHYVGTLVCATRVLQVLCHRYISVCIIGSLVLCKSFNALRQRKIDPNTALVLSLAQHAAEIPYYSEATSKALISRAETGNTASSFLMC